MEYPIDLEQEHPSTTLIEETVKTFPFKTSHARIELASKGYQEGSWQTPRTASYTYNGVMYVPANSSENPEIKIYRGWNGALEAFRERHLEQQGFNYNSFTADFGNRSFISLDKKENSTTIRLRSMEISPGLAEKINEWAEKVIQDGNTW